MTLVYHLGCTKLRFGYAETLYCVYRICTVSVKRHNRSKCRSRLSRLHSEQLFRGFRYVIDTCIQPLILLDLLPYKFQNIFLLSHYEKSVGEKVIHGKSLSPGKLRALSIRVGTA